MKFLAFVMVVILNGCQFSLKGVDSVASSEEKGRGIAIGSSASGRSITAVDIDAGPATATSDGLVFGSTWVGGCPGLYPPLRQALVGYINGVLQAFHYSFDAYRVSGVAFAVQNGGQYDLARRCNGPDTYPEAGFFSFGTKSAKTPSTLTYTDSYRAEEDGIVTASIWLGSGVAQQALTGYTGSAASLNTSNAVAWSAIERQAGDGGIVSASVAFPVKKGNYYAVRAKNKGRLTYPHAVFAQVPGLGVGDIELKSDPRGTYTAPSDGFVLASAWTGRCKRGGFRFQQLDGYMSDETGAMKRMNVRADYGDYRGLTILYPVLAGRTYKVGFYCIDSLTYATTLFIPLNK